MSNLALLDAAGRRRSPATMPGFHCGRPPRNKGLRYPADPPDIEEIVGVMRVAGTTTHGLRTRALVVVLWRAGLRISEALALAESDLDRSRGSIVVRCGKGGKRRRVGMDRWAWEQVGPWLEARVTLPVGALLCDRRPDSGTAVVSGRSSIDTAHPRRPCRGAPALRAASAPARPRRRDGP
jgi:integrase